MLAACRGHQHITQLLIDNNAKLEVKDDVRLIDDPLAIVDDFDVV